jgi:hypothetical protein
MTTKTVHSRFNKNIGDIVEGHRVIEKTVIAEPVVNKFDPAQSRMGIYNYEVEVTPTVMKQTTKRPGADFIRATPDEMGGRVVRRIKS